MGDYQTPYYPLYLDLSGKPVVVVGGGHVAQRKIKQLLSCKAAVKVVAPMAADYVRALAAEGALEWLDRPYRYGDLADASLVICACGVREVDEAVRAEAHDEGCLLNVVDVPELCDFIVPAFVERGPLRIAISTSGAAPMAAKRIKTEIAAIYDEHWNAYLVLLGEVRSLVKTRVPEDAELRRTLLEELEKSDLEERVAAGERPDAQDVYERYLTPLIVQNGCSRHAADACDGAGFDCPKGEN